MSTIKIKFKNTLTLTKFDISINFSSNGKNYKNINTYQYTSGYALNYDTYTACFPGNSWNNEANKYIEIDTSQPNFNAFITAMKSNIEGVELEAGTYQWIGTPENPTTCNTNLNFTSNNENFTGIKVYEGAVYLLAYINNGTSIDVFNYDDWDWKQGEAYRTITTSSNQYVSYDFYNYAILGNQLIKQATEITYTCKWYLDGTLVNTSTFTHEQLTGVDYNVLGSVFKVMLSASILAQYDYGVNLNGETSNASLGSDNVITIEAFKSNIVFNITSNGTTTLATKNTYVPSDIDFNVNVPSVPLQDSKLVELSMADGSNQNVMPDTNYTAMKQVIIVKPTALVAENIRNGISIAGISGSFTADANALSGNILSGKTAYVRGSKVTGSIPTYSGTTNVTSNQTLETSGKYMSSDIVVNVAGIIEIATSSAMDAVLVADNVGKYYKYTGTTDDKYTNGDIYQVQEG